MATLSVATWIGNAAAVLSGRFGAISERAKEADCGRQAMYNQVHRVEVAVACEQAGGPSDEELQAQNEPLQTVNGAVPVPTNYWASTCPLIIGGSSYRWTRRN